VDVLRCVAVVTLSLPPHALDRAPREPTVKCWQSLEVELRYHSSPGRSAYQQVSVRQLDAGCEWLP
jgi:hypothetical protein